MASVVGPAQIAGTPLPARGSLGWLAAHGHPAGVCSYGCRPPAVSWDCPLVQECANDGCNCHYGAFL
jgi:hypothetical protein